MKNKFYLLSVKSQFNIYGGPKSASTYDMSESCNSCGSGAKPVGPRYFNLNPVQKAGLHIFLTLDFDIIISKQLATIIRKSNYKCLDEIFDQKTKEKLPFYVLKPECIMPKFSKDSTGYERERSCVKCGRDGYFSVPKTPLILIYESLDEKYKNAHVVATWELFGNSVLRIPFNESVFATSLILVDEFVKKAILELEHRRVQFDEVSFV